VKAQPILAKIKIPNWAVPGVSRISRLGLAIALFWVIEWLFHYTRLSWLRFSGPVPAMMIGSKVMSAGILLGCCAQVVLEAMLLLANRLVPKLARWASVLAYGPEAAVLTITTVMFIDNVSYSFFKLGVTTLPLEAVVWYRLAIGITLLMIWVYAAHTDLTEKLWPRRIRLAALGTVVCGSMIGYLVPWTVEPAPDTGLAAGTVAKSRPNILIISIDGVESEYLSVYGYEKDSTPFLSSLARTMTIYHNHYTNNCCTTGALVSLWTGQTPLEHGVIYSPATLNASRATKHLPAMLRQLGYTTHQIGDEFYANAFKAGLRHGFDTVNFQSTSGLFEGNNPYKFWPQKFNESETTFINQVKNRITRRLQSIKDPLVAAFTADPSLPDISDTKPYEPNPISIDAQTLSQVAKLIKNAKDPWFVHVHLLGTHGFLWSPANDMFTKGMTVNQQEQIEFYLGSILDSDRAIEGLFKEFPDQLQNSLIIITSDHNMKWATKKPLPLLIHTPGQTTNRHVTDYLTQLSDIAPTILSLINVPIPDWMTGRPILENPGVPTNIYSVDSFNRTCDERGCFLPDGFEATPYGITSITVRSCDKEYEISVDPNNLTYSSQDSTRATPLSSTKCQSTAQKNDFNREMKDKLSLRATQRTTM
jgi:arylsulfatase A-like enzyme